MSDRTKTATYRKCHLTDGQNKDASTGLTLQSAIEAACQSQARPWVRALGASGSAHQLLTDTAKKNSCLCGEIVYYEPGRKIPLVDIEQDGSTFRETIHPNDSKGVTRKFQEQALYFAVRENHIALLQSLSLQSDEFQSFLSWFLQTKAGLLPDALIHLQNPPAQSAIEKMKDHQIRGISFGEKLFTKVKELDPANSKGKTKRYIHRIDTSPRLIEMLAALGVAKPILEGLAKQSDPGSIHVDVDISYRSRSEKDSVAVLRSLADSLGKQEGLETTIRLDGDSSITGDELSVRGKVKVQCPDGCIAVDDAWSKLSLWLMNEIRSGKVT